MQKNKKEPSLLDKAATQRQLQTSEKRLKAYMDKKTDEMKYHFDAAIEIIREELIGANKDEISWLKDKAYQHEDRIAVLEQR